MPNTSAAVKASIRLRRQSTGFARPAGPSERGFSGLFGNIFPPQRRSGAGSERDRGHNRRVSPAAPTVPRLGNARAGHGRALSRRAQFGGRRRRIFADG